MLKYVHQKSKGRIIRWTKKIAKKLNLYRKLTSYEEEDIVKWTENYGYDMDIIEIALKKASSIVQS